MPKFFEVVTLFDESEDLSKTSGKERFLTAEVLSDIVLKLNEALFYLDEETEADICTMGTGGFLETGSFFCIIV